MQIDSNEKQIVEEADEEYIIETSTENIRYGIMSIPIVANLDLDEEDDSGDLLEDKDKSVDGNTVSALSINKKQAHASNGEYCVKVPLAAITILTL